MNRSRAVGAILIASGMVVAVAAGLSLAVSVVQGQSVHTTLTNAGLVFIPIAVLVGAGIYQYVRSSRDIEDDADSAMRLQLQMIDLLKSSSEPTRMVDLASQLGVGVSTVGAMMNELIRLRLFSGRVDWQARVVQAIEPAKLRAMSGCINCDEPLHIQESLICPRCGTEYFLPEE